MIFFDKIAVLFVEGASNCTTILPEKCFQVFLYGAIHAFDMSHRVCPEPSYTACLPVLRLTPPGIKPSCTIDLNSFSVPDVINILG